MRGEEGRGETKGSGEGRRELIVWPEGDIVREIIVGVEKAGRLWSEGDGGAGAKKGDNKKDNAI